MHFHPPIALFWPSTYLKRGAKEALWPSFPMSGSRSTSPSRVRIRGEQALLRDARRRDVELLGSCARREGNAFSGLFMSITGGVSWEEVLGPLNAISFVWVVLYLFYIAFTHLGGEAVPTRPRYFAVLNVLTAVPRRCRPEDVFALL